MSTTIAAGSARPLLADRGFGRRAAGWRGLVSTLLGTTLLRLIGFRIAGRCPRERKLVIIGAPHTSNWDFFPALACRWALATPTHYLIKHTLMRGPLGWLLAATGAIGVDRGAPAGMIDQLVADFDRRPVLWLAIMPEGTRSRRPAWKSGFYRIARAAGVPIVCCGLDYRHRQLVFGEPFIPSGDVRRDMDRVRAFFAGIEGYRPAWASPPRLRLEATTPTDDADTTTPASHEAHPVA